MKAAAIFLTLLLATAVFSVEGDTYRLLSVSTSAKLVLVSQPGTKTKLLLDASAAKITVDGKPAEFKNLSDYSTIHVRLTQKKFNKEGVAIDGTATEIRILTPENVPAEK
ncbi:MAG: hypothetical protein HXY20_06315 [Acidobacteria bacterium]|nr:hypothetical protein [Acidobacteriota bacterium]